MLDAEAVNVIGTLKLCQVAAKAQVQHMVDVQHVCMCGSEFTLLWNICHFQKARRRSCHPVLLNALRAIDHLETIPNLWGNAFFLQTSAFNIHNNV